MNKILTVTANPAIDRVYFVDGFQMGEVHRPLRSSVTAGGKGLNVSRVSRTLGAEVIATGFLGGYAGNFMRDEISKLDIYDGFTQIKGETRTNVNISDINGISGELLESGPTIEKDEVDRFLESFGEYIRECDIVTVSGSLPKGLDSSFYVELLRFARENGKKVIMDTSGRALTEILPHKPYMVKPNKDEIAQLTLSEFAAKDALDALKTMGVEVPLISMGGKGALALVDGAYYRFTGPKVEVVNSVGSGDSMVAGIAVGIARNMPLLEAISLGMAAGISNTQFPGTGFVSAQMVNDYLSQIQVKELL